MNDFENAAKLSELEKAASQCAKGLRYKASVSRYLINSLCMNNRLRNEVLNEKYKISKYMHFTITEPKRREICATRMRDRVWQKSMCNNGLRDQLLGTLIYDNGACQQHKGVDFAIDRTICFLQKYFRQHGTNEGYYTHLDIKGYFPNTPHKETKKTVEKHVKDEKIREHVYNIIDSFKDPRDPSAINTDPFGARGTALGSEISQLMQLALPSRIDHAIKEDLRFKYYIRFNDDMLFISDNREKLNDARRYVTEKYKEIGLTVTIKQQNAKLEHGIRFLKRRIILTRTGKVIIKPLPEKISKERRRLRNMKKKLDAGEISMSRIEGHYQSVRAGIDRCDAGTKVQTLDNFYKQLFGQEPQKPKRRKKNAYSKSKAANRTARGRYRKNAGRKPET